MWEDKKRTFELIKNMLYGQVLIIAGNRVHDKRLTEHVRTQQVLLISLANTQAEEVL